LATVHVAVVHSSLIVHDVVVVPSIHETVSSYVNVESCGVLYHEVLYVVFSLNVGAVLSNLIELDVCFVVLQFPTLSQILGVI
jgi:hypothetical protein